MNRLFLPLLIALLIAGCASDTDKKSEPKSGNGIAYTALMDKQDLKSQKEIAEIEAKKSIEIEKISSETRLKHLELEKEKELALMEAKERMLKIEHEQAMQKYMLLGSILILLLSGGATLWYFDKRRKDKLRAYEDSLKKYFHQKENEARVKITEKILETVASKDLGSEQRAKLIEALHSCTSDRKEDSSPKTEQPKENDAQEAILIETKESDKNAAKR